MNSNNYGIQCSSCGHRCHCLYITIMTRSFSDNRNTCTSIDMNGTLINEYMVTGPYMSREITRRIHHIDQEDTIVSHYNTYENRQVLSGYQKQYQTIKTTGSVGYKHCEFQTEMPVEVPQYRTDQVVTGVKSVTKQATYSYPICSCTTCTCGNLEAAPMLLAARERAREEQRLLRTKNKSCYDGCCIIL